MSTSLPTHIYEKILAITPLVNSSRVAKSGGGNALDENLSDFCSNKCIDLRDKVYILRGLDSGVKHGKRFTD